ncbi:hypothetical protein N657DRAFT_650618 [Parathielavia appendiculata]|uniref:C2H2-type domain-containing protein n=1 Tax=Parathielavia appendiculata TaxID=2587402 RepID=A0AAN6YYQ7_9PEZI|nr:hypothetical protein N657DRAFT_650618 [Parathielavia appendiculata]
MSYGIETWQHSVPGEGNAEPSSSQTDGLASRLSRTASELFALALQHARRQTSKAVFRTLEREYGYLQLWCDGYGAVTGDLDDVLAESRRLRYSTYRLLVSLCQILTEKLVGVLLPGVDDAAYRRLNEKAAQAKDVVEATIFAIRNVDGSDTDSDSESDCSSFTWESSVEDIIENIKTDIRCLVDLGPRYKEPIRDRTVAEVAAVPGPVSTWDQAEYLASRIRHRYPNVDVELARILGQANWDRFRRLSEYKEQNIREAQRPANKPEPALMLSGTVVASDFHDSGLGTSLATPSSYAETVLSYHGTKGGSIKIPPAPPEALEGKPFLCDICGRTCRLPGVNWKSLWKKHVLSDLEPYVCVIPSCLYSTVPFPDKNSWKHHLDLEHEFTNTSFTCPLCQEEPTGGRLAHMARHLEEVSLTILPANAGSDEDFDGTSNESDGEASVSNSSFKLPETDTVDEPAASHKQDKLWQCEHPGCERSFVTKTQFDRHINDKHLTPRQFYCTQLECEYSRQGTKAFNRKDSWKRHMLNKHSIDPQDMTYDYTGYFPEGDYVEDTLLNSLTPDPQPGDGADTVDDKSKRIQASPQASSYTFSADARPRRSAGFYT